MRRSRNIARRLREVRLLILDVDGVLTDGRILYDGNGREMETFDVKDGHGLVLLQRSGVRVALLSGRNSPAVRWRAKDLRISLVVQGARDKLPGYEGIIKRSGIGENQVCYMGDDINDIPVMKRVGVAVAPGDALEEVKTSAHIVTGRRGGRGAVREVCDLLLKARR